MKGLEDIQKIKLIMEWMKMEKIRENGEVI